MDNYLIVVAKNQKDTIITGKEISVKHWFPQNKDSEGFIVIAKSKILRWIDKGDFIYEVTIPSDAELLEIKTISAPNEIFKTNKVIFNNPVEITDSIAEELFDVSNLQEKNYIKLLPLLANKGYINTCKKIINKIVNINNIEETIDEYEKVNKINNSYQEILDELKSFNKKDSLIIKENVNKEPYIKILSLDKVINLTGECGSGKSTFADDYRNDDDYIIVDIDCIFSDKLLTNEDEANIRQQAKEMFEKESNNNIKDLLIEHFDAIYKIILDYYKETNKTIVMDSTLLHRIKDVSLLKGKVVVMRTSIDECYKRCIEKFKKKYPKATKDEILAYSERKKKIYKWYHHINDFIIAIDRIN